jgi:predicted  nucleic acid-binding Zn-ribbon protein
LSKIDEDTLGTWAMDLGETIQAELRVLNNWLTETELRPLPTKLAEKNRDSIAELAKIANQKSELLQVAQTTFSQEQQLQSANAELTALRQKEAELKRIEEVLAKTDMNALRNEIEVLAAQIEPQAAQKREIEKQRDELTAQTTELQRQQQHLTAEMKQLQEEKNSSSTIIRSDLSKLINLTTSTRSSVDKSLEEAISNFEQKYKAYQQKREELDKAIEKANKCQTETELIRNDLAIHHQSNVELSKRLPIDSSKFSSIEQAILDRLSELDGELSKARQQLEKSKQIEPLYF